MAKKNRHRNYLDGLAAQAAHAALEQVLPPPPAYLVDVEGFAQVPDTVRDQQFGLYAQQLFDAEARLKAEATQLQARHAAFAAERDRYEEAYRKRGAETDEERGAVLSGEVTTARVVKVLLALGAVVLVSKVA